MRTYVPPEFEVQPTKAKGPNIATDGNCGLSWDDDVSTTYTPVPSGRCPFEWFHGNVDDALKEISKSVGPLMRAVIVALLDRGTITYPAVLALDTHQLNAAYDQHIGPAVDEVEEMLGDVVELEEEEYDGHEVIDAYRHVDGSITYIVQDPDGQSANPRMNDGNIATLIQTNTRCVMIDDDDAGLREAHDYYNGGRNDAMMRRYLAIYRPDIVHYDDHWSAGDSSGWGYVTRESWVAAMGEDYVGDVTPKQAFDQEVDVYRQWADDEVYGSIHVTKGKPDESCWGHLGYDDHKDIAEQYGPVSEVLA